MGTSVAQGVLGILLYVLMAIANRLISGSISPFLMLLNLSDPAV